MYIHNPSSNIDELNGLGIVNPNIVSGDDLDNQLAGQGGKSHYSYVSDEATVQLEQELLVAKQKLEYATAQKARLIKTYGDAMQILQGGSQALSILDAKIAGTYGRGGAGTPEQMVTWTAEAAKIRAKLVETEDIWKAAGTAVGNFGDDILAGREIRRIESELAVLNKHTSTQRVSDPDPIEVVTDEPVGEVDFSPVVTAKKGLLEQIGAKVGLSKNQTLIALGAATVLGIVVVSRK